MTTAEGGVRSSSETPIGIAGAAAPSRESHAASRSALPSVKPALSTDAMTVTVKACPALAAWQVNVTRNEPGPVDDSDTSAADPSDMWAVMRAGGAGAAVD